MVVEAVIGKNKIVVPNNLSNSEVKKISEFGFRKELSLERVINYIYSLLKTFGETIKIELTTEGLVGETENKKLTLKLGIIGDLEDALTKTYEDIYSLLEIYDVLHIRPTKSQKDIIIDFPNGRYSSETRVAKLGNIEVIADGVTIGKALKRIAEDRETVKGAKKVIVGERYYNKIIIKNESGKKEVVILPA